MGMRRRGFFTSALSLSPLMPSSCRSAELPPSRRSRRAPAAPPLPLFYRSRRAPAALWYRRCSYALPRHPAAAELSPSRSPPSSFIFIVLLTDMWVPFRFVLF
jgi:hypothetical protein